MHLIAFRLAHANMCLTQIYKLIGTNLYCSLKP